MIDLTPLEVRQKKADFSRALRGYEAGEVDDFLGLVADRLEALVKENMVMKDRLTRLEEQLTEFRQRERALTDALVTAQQMREEVRKQSSREADLLKQEAIQQAERIRAEGAQAREREEEILRRLRARQAQLIQSYRSFLERELTELAVVADSLADPKDEQARRRTGKKPARGAPRSETAELPLGPDTLGPLPGDGLAAEIAAVTAAAAAAAAAPALDAYSASEPADHEDEEQEELAGLEGLEALEEEEPEEEDQEEAALAPPPPPPAPAAKRSARKDAAPRPAPRAAPPPSEFEELGTIEGLDGVPDQGQPSELEEDEPLPLLGESDEPETDDYALALEIEAELEENDAPAAPAPAAEALLPWEEGADEERDPWDQGLELRGEDDEGEDDDTDPAQLELPGDEAPGEEDDEPDWLSSILREEP